MANLNFKFGEYKNLSKVTPSITTEGTIYVTTDEKAIYVDLGQKRLRLGDIIVQDSAETAKPPFTENAFYYFSAENALCRYTTEDGWKQLNNTTDLKHAIDANTSSITALTKTVETNTTNISGLTTRMNTAESNIITAQEQADKGVADAATAQSTANTNKDNLGSLTTKVDNIDGSLNATKNTVATHGTDIVNIKEKDEQQDGRLSVLEGLINGEVEGGSNITTQLAALKVKDAELVNEDKRLADLISGNTSTIKEVKKTADANKETLNTYTPKVDKAVEDISALKETVKTHTTDIAALKKKDEDLVAKDSELNGKIAENTSAINAVKTTADKNKETLGTYTPKVDKAVIDISNLTEAVGTNAKGHETGIYKEIANLKVKDTKLGKEDEKLAGLISGNTDVINNNTKAITEIKDTIIGKDGEQGRSTGLYKTMDDKIDAALQTADAMTFVGVVSSDADFSTKYKEYHAGDTYKVAANADFTLEPGVTQKCYIGDLLIVKKDGSKTFHYVPSGGQDHENLKLTTENNTVKLHDDIDPNMGQVSFQSNNANLTIKTVGLPENATITFTLAWGTF